MQHRRLNSAAEAVDRVGTQFKQWAIGRRLITAPLGTEHEWFLLRVVDMQVGGVTSAAAGGPSFAR
jgi:hypothetical protein